MIAVGTRALPGEPPNPKKLLVSAILLALAFGALWLRRPDPAPVSTSIAGSTMGTTFDVRFAGELSMHQSNVATALVRTALDEVDLAMSTYKPESEISRLNRAGTAEFALSPETLGLLRLSFNVNAGSGGAFDPTVGPLVRAWGFGPDDRESLPSDAEVQVLREDVGLERLQLSETGVTKSGASVEVDLSAIAKGYAVDRVSESLAEAGLPNHLVEVGGELRASGVREDGSAWRVAIDKPLYDGREVEQVVELTGSMATSGDYRNWVQDGNVRRSHTIDPRTGYPVEHSLASVTVLSPDCASADAWATAFMVMGEKKGLVVAENLAGLEAMFLIRTDGGFERVATSGFPEE